MLFDLSLYCVFITAPPEFIMFTLKFLVLQFCQISISNPAVRCNCSFNRLLLMPVILPHWQATLCRNNPITPWCSKWLSERGR